MTTRQPEWKFVANLGDASPVDHGGLFIYEDATGVYDAEMERLERESDRDDSKFTIHRVCLDRCKEVQGERDKPYLVPYRYEPTWPHPLPDYEEWFADDLDRVAESMGTTERVLRDQLCSDDSKARAEAYRCILDYHGWENGDEYPLTLASIDDVEDRYTRDEISKRDPIDRLREALEAEHSEYECNNNNNNTCDISKAMREGLYLWAARLLTGATECPRTSSALALCNPSKQELDEECADLLEHPHMTCGECNANVWTDEDKDTCGNCRETVQRSVKIENSDDTEETEHGTMHFVLVTARGPGAARWAKERQQSLCGSCWEADGDDFAYVSLVDSPNLLDEIREELGADVEIDDGEYSPADE